MRILSVFFFLGGVALFSTLFSCNSETISIDISNEIIVPRNYKIPYADQPLVIDGKDTEPSWQNASFSEDFIDIEGQKKTAQNTRLKMLWDQDFLYIYAKLEEKHIWATLKNRDTIIFYNNDFEVFISPSNSNHNYGEIEINALGTVWDLLLDRPYNTKGNPIFNWNIQNLKSAVHIEGTLNNPNDIDQYWSVEMAIPMEALTELKRSPKKKPIEGEQWRINFSRVQWEHDLIDNRYYRKKENGKFLRENNWVWSSQGVINMHLPEHWGYIEFSESPHPDGSWTYKTDYRIEQILYAVFRKIAYKEYTHLKNKTAGTKTQIVLPGFENDNLHITLLNTFSGFDLSLTHTPTGTVYTINEKGYIQRPQDY
ncbi:MAG: carbohydrate-binding family 9-like protein [Flavobacteriia bacterium]|nr:carbohydrate-binding family 9-like protein [Flavobacteriia bacterium]